MTLMLLVLFSDITIATSCDLEITFRGLTGTVMEESCAVTHADAYSLPVKQFLTT